MSAQMKVLMLGGSRLVARPGATTDEKEAVRAVHEQPENPLPIQRVQRLAWPNEKLPGLVEAWMKEEQPDMVLVMINEAWFNYEGVPVKRLKKKGPVGRLGNHLWRVIAQREGVMRSRLAHRARRKLAEATGAEPEFTPEQVVDRMSAVFRTILRADESTSVLVIGPLNLPEFDQGVSEKSAKKRLARRERVNTGISKLCRELHLEHIDMYHEALAQREMPSMLADGLHTDADGARNEAAFWRSVFQPFFVRELLRRGEMPGLRSS